MSCGTLLRVVYTDAQRELALDNRIELPYIDVSAKLAEALEDEGQPISLNTQSVVDGMIARKVSCLPTDADSGLVGKEALRIIVSANQEPQKFDMEFRDKKSRRTAGFLVATDPSILDQADYEADQAFWTTLICASILADDEASSRQLEIMRSTIDKRARITKMGAIGLTGLAASSTVLSQVNIRLAGIPPAVFLVLKAVGSTTKFMADRTRKPLENVHLLSEEFEDRVERKIRTLADKIAELHPVIEYKGGSFTEFEEIGQ